ncbi:hypothetical protein J7295_00467 [Nakaseomyces glabratus]|nr:hypothetical protein J7298_00466 [Nakaseomyces glabratus]KAH7607782.1 hypothetical protein J7295_00467 [Nakaseomyces glabratus]KAH7614932.1 hypothetical protein J7292_00464 [Nakaseomyces glabratus]
MSSLGEELETKISEEVGFKPLGIKRILPAASTKLPFASLDNFAIDNHNNKYAAASGELLICGDLQKLREYVTNDNEEDNYEPEYKHEISNIIALKFMNGKLILVTKSGRICEYSTENLNQELMNHELKLDLVSVKTLPSKIIMLDSSNVLKGLSLSNLNLENIAENISSFDVLYDKLVYISVLKDIYVSDTISNGVNKKIILPESLSEELDDGYEALDIKILSENEYFVVFGNNVSPDESDPSYDHKTYVVSQKEESVVYQETFDIAPAFASVLRYPCYYNVILPGIFEEDKNVNIIGSATSSEISVWDSVNVVQPDQDSERAVFPISKETDEDTTPIGMCLDFSTVGEIPEPCPGVDNTDSLPLVYSLTNEGFLQINGFYHTGLIKAGKYDIKLLGERIYSIYEQDGGEVEEGKNDEPIGDFQPTISEDKEEELKNSNNFELSKKSPFSGLDKLSKKPSFSSMTLQIDDEVKKNDTNKTFEFGKTSFGKPGFGTNSSNNFGSVSLDSADNKSIFSKTSTETNSTEPAFGKPAFGKPAFGALSDIKLSPSNEPVINDNTTPPSNISKNDAGSSAFAKPTFGNTAFGSLSSSANSENNNINNSPFGKPAFGSTGFGSSSSIDKPTFGSTAFASTNTNSTSFGNPSFANIGSDNNSFGKPAFGSTAFGTPAFSIKTEKNDTDSSPFGKPAFGSTGFGSSSSIDKPTFGSTTFGSSNTNSTSFGNPSFGSTAFAATTNATSPFAKLASNSFRSETPKLDSLNLSSDNEKPSSDDENSESVSDREKSIEEEHDSEFHKVADSKPDLEKPVEVVDKNLKSDTASPIVDNIEAAQSNSSNILNLSNSPFAKSAFEKSTGQSPFSNSFSNLNCDSKRESQVDNASSSPFAKLSTNTHEKSKVDNGSEKEGVHEVQNSDEAEFSDSTVEQTPLADLDESKGQVASPSISSLTERIKQKAQISAEDLKSPTLTSFNSSNANAGSPFSSYASKLGQVPASTPIFKFTNNTAHKDSREVTTEDGVSDDNNNNNNNNNNKRNSEIADCVTTSSSSQDTKESSAERKASGEGDNEPLDDKDIGISESEKSQTSEEEQWEVVSTDSDAHKSVNDTKKNNNDEADTECDNLRKEDDIQKDKELDQQVKVQDFTSSDIVSATEDVSVSAQPKNDGSGQLLSCPQNVIEADNKSEYNDFDNEKGNTGLLSTTAMDKTSETSTSTQTANILHCDFEVESFEDDELYLSIQNKPNFDTRYYVGANTKGMSITSEDKTVQLMEKTVQLIDAELSVLFDNIDILDRNFKDQSTNVMHKTSRSLELSNIWRMSEYQTFMTILDDLVEKQQIYSADRLGESDEINAFKLRDENVIKERCDAVVSKLARYSILMTSQSAALPLSRSQEALRNTIRQKMQSAVNKLERLQTILDTMKISISRAQGNSVKPMIANIEEKYLSHIELLDTINRVEKKIQSLQLGELRSKKTAVDTNAEVDTNIGKIDITSLSMKVDTRKQIGDYFKHS